MEDINYVFTDPDNPEIDYAELDFDDQLKHTQRIKGKVLHKLVAGPTGVPTDKDSVELLLKVADSMDKTTIAKRRLAVDEKQGDGAISILNAIVHSIREGGGANPFVREVNSEPLQNQSLGELPTFEGDHAIGEAEIGVIVETSDNFTRRMEIVNKEEMDKRAQEMGLTGNDVRTEIK